jgi:diguanylate cyclase
MARNNNPTEADGGAAGRRLAELQEREQELAASQGILEKAMARLALLGFDHEPELDAPLSELRTAIRAEKSPREVAEKAHVVESTMRRMGLPRESGSHPPLPGQVLSDLLDQLSLPRRLDLDRRQLRQRLRQATVATPPDQLLAELASLLEDALSDPGPAKGIRSLFGKGPSANAGRPLRILLDELVLPGEFQETQEEIEERLTGAGEEEAARAADELAAYLNDFLTGAPPAVLEVRRPLNRLLDALSEGEETTPGILDLYDRIAAGPPSTELPAILDETAQQAAKRNEEFEQERHDLESFLQQLVGHLNDLGHRFEATSSLREAARETARQHDNTLHAQMDELETDLQQSEDLDNLKEAVKTRLESVRERIEAHREAEEERDRDLEAEVNALRTRMREMEKESEELRNRLHQEWLQAHTDPLTGLANRLGYEEEARTLMARRQEEGIALSLAVVDIDHFKALNDNFGHQAGDKALKVIGGLLQRQLPQGEAAFLARYGGEEFVCLFPGGEGQEAVEAVERMRQGVEEAVFTFQQKRIRITLSAGVSELGPRDTVQSAFKRADRALLEAKQAGRNTIRQDISSGS